MYHIVLQESTLSLYVQSPDLQYIFTACTAVLADDVESTLAVIVLSYCLHCELVCTAVDDDCFRDLSDLSVPVLLHVGIVVPLFPGIA